MVITSRSSRPSPTFLSPGQQFESTEAPVLETKRELTVARLVRDRLGLLHVTLRTAEGREISAFAAQVEAAIADGHLRLVANHSASSC